MCHGVERRLDTEWRAAGTPPPAPTLAPMRRLAPAKLNLHLRVGPPRGDGFHPIDSWFATIGLFDTVHLEADPAGQGEALRFRRDDPAVPSGDENLCVRAVEAYAAAFGRPATRLNMVLEKRIPAGGGLGGGSSDAAAVLRLLAELHGNDAQLDDVAAGLGSDVPFFLVGGSARCTGRGEVVTPLPRPRAGYAVLILPAVAMSTPAVYQAFDDLPARDADPDDEDYAAWSGLPAAELLPRLANDLEPAAFALHPDLDELRAAAEAACGRPVRMTGSGSTLFTLADDADDAAAVARAIEPIGPAVRSVELCPAEEALSAGGGGAGASDVL